MDFGLRGLGFRDREKGLGFRENGKETANIGFVELGLRGFRD